MSLRTGSPYSWGKGFIGFLDEQKDSALDVGLLALSWLGFNLKFTQDRGPGIYKVQAVKGEPFTQRVHVVI